MKRNAQQRRSLLKQASLAALLGGAGITSLIGRVLAAGGDPARPGIRRMSGQVSVNGAPAHANLLIQPGDTVVTEAASEAIYVIGQDAFLQRAASRVSFGDGAAAGVLRVVTGRLLSVFAVGERRIETPTATIGIRGTGCYIEAEAERVYFCLCYGVAELTPTAAPQEREVIRTKHHDKPQYIYNDMKMPKMSVPAEVINHRDEELEMLEALVGRRPPLERLGGY